MATPVLPAVPTTVKIEYEGSVLRPVLFTLMMGGIASILVFSLNIAEVAANWDKYRCQPQYMATARLFGKDPNENFAYCAQNVFKNEVGGVVGPIYKVMAQGTGVMYTILETANSLRIGLSTLSGGLQNIVQDFTSRITQFFAAIRMQAQRLRALMYRVYGTLIATFFMFFSGITAVQNFSDTTVGSFLSFIACFPPTTPIRVEGRGLVSIADVHIGDQLDGGCCTGIFHFYADGTPMVRLGDVTVSETHYILYKGRWIMAGKHPDARPVEAWAGGTREPLICLNTDTHMMRIGGHTFRDYDETDEGDVTTEQFVERSLNGGSLNVGARSWSEYGPLVHPSMKLRLKDGATVRAGDLQLGAQLEGGGEVRGLVRKRTTEITESGLTPSTLIYNGAEWVRAGRLEPTIRLEEAVEYVCPFVYPHSYMVSDSGLPIRDYMEVCNPFTEDAYSAALGAACLVTGQ